MENAHCHGQRKVKTFIPRSEVQILTPIIVVLKKPRYDEIGMDIGKLQVLLVNFDLHFIVIYQVK